VSGAPEWLKVTEIILNKISPLKQKVFKYLTRQFQWILKVTIQ